MSHYICNRLSITAANGDGDCVCDRGALRKGVSSKESLEIKHILLGELSSGGRLGIDKDIIVKAESARGEVQGTLLVGPRS